MQGDNLKDLRQTSGILLEDRFSLYMKSLSFTLRPYQDVQSESYPVQESEEEETYCQGLTSPPWNELACASCLWKGWIWHPNEYEGEETTN